MAFHRQPYPQESQKKLVVAFDVGTTYSGVSYCILNPGFLPEIVNVNHYPSQDLSEAKIPSIMWYSKDGLVQAVGAEATCTEGEERAEENGWFKVEWFKLHLRPRGLVDKNNAKILQRIPPLPFGLTILTVFADFFSYLLDCTRTFIEEGSPSGSVLWASVASNIDFVISHPNGWGGTQQTQLRQAAIRARLVPETDAGAKRIHFVTEGEASLHFCITKNLMTEAMKNDGKIVVVDAGGGTIDLSSYGRGSTGGRQLYEELASPRCLLQGSIFVTEYARTYIDDFLKDSDFAGSVLRICEAFDKTTKIRFRSATGSMSTKFGNTQDEDLKHNIRCGRLSLPGEKVASFFQPAVTSVVEAIMEHFQYTKANTVFFVGGFAENDWLFHQVKGAVAQHGIDVCRPDGRLNKAVAEGGVSFFIDHYVTARMAKYAYGTEATQTFNSDNPAHGERLPTCYKRLSGSIGVPGRFSIILKKNTKVTEKEVFRNSYFCEVTSIAPLMYNVEILYYTGSLLEPEWLDEDRDNFKVLCKIEADLTAYASTLKPRTGPTGNKYYRVSFDIVISFGLTELVAQIAWMDKGIEKRGPARIIYDDE